MHWILVPIVGVSSGVMGAIAATTAVTALTVGLSVKALNDRKHYHRMYAAFKEEGKEGFMAYGKHAMRMSEEELNKMWDDHHERFTKEAFKDRVDEAAVPATEAA